MQRAYTKVLCFQLTSLLLLFLFSLASCITNEDYDNNPKGNFNALWTILNDHYCFFEQKGIDWNQVYAKYAPRINNKMSEEQQFEVMTDMLSELKDGHVNLYTAFNLGRYWQWHEQHKKNFSDSLERKYLKTDYRIASGMKYTLLTDNIGYIRYNSFQNAISPAGLDHIFLYFKACKGLIIDIRNNGGGNLSYAEELAARFTNKPVLVGYMQHKTGKGHHDFSPLKAQTIQPGKGIRWQKPVIVLTNRSVYSSGNEFVKYMKAMPLATIIGDRTGGGSGLPFSAELPNGWAVRFSACPMYDKDKNMTEFGIDPDYKVDLSDADLAKGIDTMIEFARQIIAQQN